ncbi:hypothetical protein ABET51_07995 [Metabacillus fastidiosus]|uniref:hypothetical protein n=1 Tax=Metabacillus fastidiosus TaxID=1458 RepID=UPI002E23C2DF|nr:hypothetical protein [Metabacillus fastidiosus]
MLKQLRTVLVLVFIIFSFLIPHNVDASTTKQYKDAVTQGEQLRKLTVQYNQLILINDIEKINRFYDQFTSQLRKTEIMIGRVPGKTIRRQLNEKYVRPAKIAKERTIYEVSQYRFMNIIQAKLSQANIETARQDFKKLDRLVERSAAIKIAGNYELLPLKIQQDLQRKYTELKNQYEEMVRSLDPNNPNYLFPKLTELKGKWSGLSENEKRDIIQKDAWTLVGDTKYIGYLPKHLAFLYHLTGDEQYKTMVKEFIPLFEKYYLKKGRLQSIEYQNTGWWYRDQFARDNRSLFEAYKYTEIPEVLDFVDNQASMWIEQVPRSTNIGFNIFSYGISDAGKIGPIEINPNQNIQIATLFSYLYWEPESKFYQSALAKDIVLNEVGAVLALQKKNGSLPLTQNLPLVEDTNYGGYSGNMLYQLAQVWGNEKWMKSAVDIGNWLYREYSMEHPWNTKEDAPNYAIDRINSFNLISRVLQFYAAGVPDEKVREWINFAEKRFPDEKLYLLERWYSYQSIPRSYLDSKIYVKNQLPPKVYSDFYPDKGSIRIIAEEIVQASVEIVNQGRNEVIETIAITDDLNTSIQLEKGIYEMKIEARAANGKVMTDTKTLTVNESTAFLLKVQLFDKNHRFYQKLK